MSSEDVDITDRTLRVENKQRQQIDALRRELEALETNLLEDARRTQIDLEQLAAAECLAITTTVMTLLPREIRDMVYRHLSTRSNERIEKEQSRATLDPLTRLYSYNHARWKAAHFPEAYWNAAYVGAPFYQELIENYYRTSTFVFGDEPDVMTRFLHTNEFNLPSLLPCHLVANVAVHLDAVSCDRGSFRAYLFGVPKTAARLQEQVEPLFGLKPGARICIHFRTEAKRGADRKRYCQDGLETLFSSAQRAKLKGYRVRFVVDETHVFALEADMMEEWAGMHG